jgi:hypothetical protein
MSDTVKEALKTLLKMHGESLCSDHIRLKGLLYDTCPSYRKERTVLTVAVQEGCIAELSKESVSDVYVHALASRLHHATGIDQTLAHWSITAWAEAMGSGYVSNARYCTFCGKSWRDVRSLIAGKSVSICDDCVAGCVDLTRARQKRQDRLVYRSDFDVPSDRWGEGMFKHGQARAFRQDGYYHMVIDRPPWFQYCSPGIPIVDFRVYVDAQFANTSGNTTECGVVFRLKSINGEDSYYKFIISRTGSYALRIHCQGGHQDILSDRFSEVINRNERTNTLMVEMVGQKITLGINGHFVATVLDNYLPYGHVGLLVAANTSDIYAETRFQDFRLYSIEITPEERLAKAEERQ